MARFLLFNPEQQPSGASTMYRIQNGFTLIERRIVVAIIGTPPVPAPTTATGGVHRTRGASGSTNRYRPADCRG